MKKIIQLLMLAGVAAFVACGPSAEEKARVEQTRLDSIEQVRITDSTMTAEAEAAAMQKAAQDSIIMADSIAKVAMQDSMDRLKANVKPSKPKVKPIKPQDVKPGQGKG